MILLLYIFMALMLIPIFIGSYYLFNECDNYRQLLKHPMILGSLIALLISFMFIAILQISNYQLSLSSLLNRNISVIFLLYLLVFSFDCLLMVFQENLNEFRDSYKTFYIRENNNKIPVKRLHIRGLSLIGKSGLPYATLLFALAPVFVKFMKKYSMMSGFGSWILFIGTACLYEFIIFILSVVIYFLEKSQLHLEQNRLYSNAILRKIFEYMQSHH